MAYFDGYMRIYIKTVGLPAAKTEFTEDWADPKIRKRILGKKRKFSITVYLYNTAGDHIVETMPLNFKGDQELLGDLILQEVNRMKKENPYQEFDLPSSYVNVRA